MEVCFVSAESYPGSLCKAEIVFARTELDGRAALAAKTPQRLIFCESSESRSGLRTITLAASPALPGTLRSQQFELSCERFLPSFCTGEPLAYCDEGALWMKQQGDDQEIDMVSDSPSELGSGEFLFDLLQAPRWTGLLPLIEFLRRVKAEEAWVPPPLRACFMFDDPNLHRPTYGFVDYAALARHAREHCYHVSIATIPLDAWFTHRRVAALFRTEATRLSLLVHGNNHTYAELAQSYRDPEQEGLVAQSLKRMARLERTIDAPIPKVMTGPHGACSESMAGELLRQGYEAACISQSSLRSFNPQKSWPPAFGLEPAEFLSSGFPVTPRFRLSRTCLPNAIIAGWLGQPIVPVGHHQDLAGGLGLLAEMSEKINRLGAVSWSNMSQIVRGNFKHRVRGETLQLRMFARRIDVDVPPDTATVQVDRSWLRRANTTESLQVRMEGETWASVNEDIIRLPRTGGNGQKLELRSVCSQTADYREVPSQRMHMWAILRRAMTETRDRLHGRGS